jgi:hypothetical protein
MHIYLILLLGENAAVGERVQRAYPEAFKYNSTTFLVIDSSPITENIAIQVGIKGDDRVGDASGFVIKLGNPPSYSGFTIRPLWDWLGAAVEKAQ